MPGWQERSRFIARHGHASYYHYDFYAQALAKLERAERKDVADVEAMLARGLVEPRTAWALFRAIEPLLYRYPALDPAEFRGGVAAVLGPEAAGG